MTKFKRLVNSIGIRTGMFFDYRVWPTILSRPPLTRDDFDERDRWDRKKSGKFRKADGSF